MFGLFGSKRKSLVASGLLQGAVDNHSHVLYGVDDGVKTVEESLKILHFLEEAGVETLWLTPHIMEDVPNTTGGLQDRFAQLRAAYPGPVRLELAAEYMMDTLFLERLRARDLLLHGGDRVLMETSTWSPPIDLWDLIDETYEKLIHRGCLLQLNLPSIVGVYGEEARQKAQTLLDKGWYCMFGSDCHRFRAIHAQYQAEVLKADTLARLAKLARGIE